jgi:hypothetical protein
MNNKHIESAANIGLLASVVFYVFRPVVPYTTALIVAYIGFIISIATAALGVYMMVKKTDGKGITLHKIVLMIPLLWYLLNVVSY